LFAEVARARDSVETVRLRAPARVDRIVCAWIHSPVVQLVGALVAGGLGVPVPEELALVTAGYWIWRGHDGATLAVAALAAVLVGDLTLYGLGRGGAQLALARRIVGARRRAQLERAFARHGARLVLAGRFVPGLRSAMLVAAGASRMPLVRLAAWDGLAAGAATALWISVGVRLGPQIERARAIVDGGRAVAALVVAVVVIVLLLRRRGRARAAGEVEG
jgi:membrane protein DedA with SNARE-associated domain